MWYQEAVSVFTKISVWIAGPIIIALFIGDWLDHKYLTDAKYTLICVGIAFIISNIGLVLEVLAYNKKIKKINPTNKDKESTKSK